MMDSGGTWIGASGITPIGDVDGPASATDNAVARFDGTTGKLIKDSVVIIDNSGNVTGVNSLNTITATEISYLSGLSSNAQTQLNNKQTLDATLTALAAYNTNGILTQTAADTFVGRTIVGTADQVNVGNGDGVSGNPTLSLPQSIATTSSPSFTGLTVSGLAASRALTTNGSSALAVSTTTATELDFVSGVTSAIQTQLNNKQTLDATLTALAAYNTNGFIAQTAADTFAGRTHTGTANQVLISNGDGVSGNPTYSLPQSIATSSTPTFGGLTVSNLTSGRVTFAGASGLLTDDADMTFATDTLSVTKLLAPTSVSTPSIITASGALTITPTAGSNLNINLSTTGDFAVNTSAFYVDTSTANIGIGVTTPSMNLAFSGSISKTFGVERNPGGNQGGDLIISAGGAAVGSTNRTGGRLILGAGISTGTGTSSILFGTAPAGASGTGDNASALKMSLLGNGNLGIGEATPTGVLHLKAGTATASTAPLKFTSGTNLTSAEAGAVEWNGVNLFITATSGPTRKTIAYNPMTTGGDIIYGGSSGVETRLANGSADQALVSQGTTVAPIWGPVIKSGTYSPTASTTTNLDATPTMSSAQYLRVGSTVTVSGRFTADPTTTLTPTSFEITLPVASNFGAVEDAAGIAFCGSIAGQGAAITGSVANDRAVISWSAVDVTSQDWSYTFTYEVI